MSEDANKIQGLNQGIGRKSTGGRRSNSQCEACGSKAHSFDVCKFKTKACHRCQQKGHIRPVCKGRLPESSFQRRSNISRHMSVNSCKLNQEEGDDPSSRCMKTPQKERMPSDLVCAGLELIV